jgi:hypothetical protein
MGRRQKGRGPTGLQDMQARFFANAPGRGPPLARRLRREDILAQHDEADAASVRKQPDSEDEDVNQAPGPRGPVARRNPNDLSLEVLAHITDETDAKRLARVREQKRLDMKRIEAYLGKKAGQYDHDKYECCAQYCLRLNRQKDNPLLVELAYNLRLVLAYESTAGQNDVVYTLCKDKWCFKETSPGVFKGGFWEQYAIPEAHAGEQICS